MAIKLAQPLHQHLRTRSAPRVRWWRRARARTRAAPARVAGAGPPVVAATHAPRPDRESRIGKRDLRTLLYSTLLYSSTTRCHRAPMTLPQYVNPLPCLLIAFRPCGEGSWTHVWPPSEHAFSDFRSVACFGNIYQRVIGGAISSDPRPQRSSADIVRHHTSPVTMAVRP